MNPLPPIVSAQWLAENLTADTASGTSPRIRVADVRSYLDGRSGRDAYVRGHIPGAVFVSLDEVLAAPASSRAGRHPLPEPEVFARGLAAAGIGTADPVVAYDDLGGMTAGRLVWMLRIIGAPAALLDGGLPAWTGPLQEGDEVAQATERSAVPWPSEELADAEDVAAAVAAGSVVVDARAAERFRGDVEPLDPRTGHVPGAINLPFAANLDDEQRFLPSSELVDRFAGAGVGGGAIMYCGSGVSACHNILAMEACGLERPRLFVGSWSQWSSDDERPAATGD